MWVTVWVRKKQYPKTATYEKQKSSKSDDFEDFWSVLTKKMQAQSLALQGLADFWGSIFRFAIRTPGIL